ncbi:MAG: DEAD/DEAH box helicase [Desulfovibrionaceae bacterium]|nr:DEAD/DEAH box helicase [Desulfovibrionaceae bacterium]
MDIFHRFAPFIQDFIYLNNWTELRAVQVAAAEVLFNSDDNLLLASNTASGKTEAAFFPILTNLYENPPLSIGALYIGPLKALINDQFLRLEYLCRDVGIPIWRWHGDVAQGSKEKLLKNPSGILQITPEALEALLIRRHSFLPKLFKDLRFIVIDEVHSLLRGDRGGQTLCCLERLARIVKINPRRIGLSATIGDPEATGNFLAQGTNRKTAIPQFKVANAKWRISMEHFLLPRFEEEVEKADLSEYPEELKKDVEEAGQFRDAGLGFIFEHTRGKKSLIFVNSREDCEVVTASLRRLCEATKEDDRFLIHHGNLSTSVREVAEKAMRDEHEVRSTVTTSTLELGVDIGKLERVFQLDSPFSVASFLQRLGRTGRRGNPPEMAFVFREYPQFSDAPFPLTLHWKLLQAIAIVQLYQEERWVEPPRISRVPYSLLYHQTLSIIASEGELTASQLAGRVLTLSYFKNVSPEDYRQLLRYLLETEVLQFTENKGLILGRIGESQTGFYKFYAVFKDNEEFRVRADGEEIGTIVNPPPVGDKIALAGHVWVIDEIDYQKHKITCSKVPGKVIPYFGQCPGDIHTKIIEKIRDVLKSETVYPYLLPNARLRLAEARETASITGMLETPLVNMGKNNWCLFPWLGTYAFQTMERFLKKVLAKHLGLSGFESSKPYFMLFHMDANPKVFFASLKQMVFSDFNPINLLGPSEIPMTEKYDSYIPPLLVRKGYLRDRLDMNLVQERVSEWVERSLESSAFNLRLN